MSLQFKVIGVPAPQGSKRHLGHGVMVEMSQKVKPWRQDVAAAALEARQGGEAFDGPLCVSIRFTLARPKSLPKSRRFPDRKPDLDKLVRSTLDALVTSGMIADDARVVNLFASKDYAMQGDALGASIIIRRVAGAA